MVGLNVESIVSFPHNTFQTGEGAGVIGGLERGPVSLAGQGHPMVLRRLWGRTHARMNRTNTLSPEPHYVGRRHNNDDDNNNNSNNNNNIKDNIYVAVVMAEPLQEFTRCT